MSNKFLRSQRQQNPSTPKNARNALNFDYLNPGHINPHPRHESPKFGLFCPKNGKYHVASYPECTPKHLAKQKTPQNTAKQTRGATLMTPQQPVRHLDVGQICINQNPRKDTHKYNSPHKICNKKNSENIPRKVGNSLIIKNFLKNQKFELGLPEPVH